MSERRIAAPGARPAPRGGRGYSLVELIVGLAVTLIVLLGLFQVFQTNTQIARTQTDLADMQQSLRVAQNEMTRLIRMAGRGGLAEMLDNGGNRLLPAMTVRDNVGSGEEIAIGFPGSPLVVEGTDVITVRGVFSSPAYQINFADPTTFTLFDAGGAPTTDPTQAASGQVILADPSPSGIPQDLTALAQAVSPPGGGPGTPEALILVSPVNEQIYAVVELDPANSNVGGNLATLRFLVQGGTYTQQYRNLYASGVGAAPVLPTTLTSATMVGIIEENRFYIRDADPSPTLSMARMFPGTEIPRGAVTEARLDIADNILDLQVALGFDSDLGDVLIDRNADGRVNEDDIVITEYANGQNDDWLFNSDQDNPNVSPWVPPWDDDPVSGTPPQPELYFLRLTTLARVQVPERVYQSALIARLENTPVAPYNTRDQRQFRRQLMQTTIDLRNL